MSLAEALEARNASRCLWQSHLEQETLSKKCFKMFLAEVWSKECFKMSLAEALGARNA